MAQVAGIKVERTSGGIPTFARIDLRKHTEFIPILKEKGVEVDEPVKWTAKMKRSFEQAKNGEIYKVEEPVKWTAKMKQSFAQAKNGEVYARSLEDLLNV